MSEENTHRPLTVDRATEIARKYLYSWTGAIVARDKDFTGGVGRVISEPGDDGVAWVYWGAGDGVKFETREVVVEMVRLDLDDDFMRRYVRDE